MESWLKCEVSAGQFDAEAAVQGKDYSGEEFSLFVPMADVRCPTVLGKEWSPGRVRVEVLDSRDSHLLVYLPGQTFGNGQSITVRDEQVVEGRAQHS